MLDRRSLIIAASGLGLLLLTALPLWRLSTLGRDDGVAVPPQTSTPGFERLQVIKPPRPVPATGFQDAEGNPVGLDAFRGKVVVLNFWATWCTPCVKEMPALDQLQADMAGSGVAVVALSSDRGGAATVREFFDKQSLRNLKIYVDAKNEVGRGLTVRGLPTTVLIDAWGQEVARLEGQAAWDSPQAKELVGRILAGAAL